LEDEKQREHRLDVDTIKVISPLLAFGKLERDSHDMLIGWHPLVDHMIDVAACFECLSACHSIRRAMEKAAGRVLDDRDIARLSVLVFLHDIGKANSGFQAKRWKKWQDFLDWPVLIHAGHDIEALKLFDSSNRLDHLLELLPVDQMDDWGESCYSLLVASLSHHGRPIKGNRGENIIWKNVSAAYNPAVVLQGFPRVRGDRP
jgi:CRISPR-associated endonuclease/helicase Cas3